LGRIPGNPASGVVAWHAELTKTIGVKVYFADCYSPWQPPSNENMNGLIHEYLPKGAELSAYTQHDLDAIAHRLDTRPRKAPNFQTSRELFDRLFKRALPKPIGRCASSLTPPFSASAQPPVAILALLFIPGEVSSRCGKPNQWAQCFRSFETSERVTALRQSLQ
jgi:hypothetical protein